MREYEPQERALPIVGANLVKLSFCGNGKDSQATIDAEGMRRLIIPLSDASMDICITTGATVRTRGRGDTEVVLEVVPTTPLRIAEAVVLFPGGDDEWDECLRELGGTGPCELFWCVELRLRLVPISDQQKAEQSDAAAAGESAISAGRRRR